MGLLFALPCSYAQQAVPEAPAATAETPRRYTVEIIVFEYARSAQTGNELFAAEPAQPETDDLADESREFSDTGVAGGSAAAAGKPIPEEVPLSRQIELTLLRPEQYTMRDIYRKLQTLDAYEPILHTAWSQTTVEKELAPPIRLRMLGDAPTGLDGELTLYLSRYLHLVVDLALDAEPSAESPGGNSYGAAETTSQGGYIYSDKPDLGPQTVRYRIFEDRIFKIGDLRYFDHPKFGVLAKVTRDEATESATASPGPVPGGPGTL